MLETDLLKIWKDTTRDTLRRLYHDNPKVTDEFIENKINDIIEKNYKEAYALTRNSYKKQTFPKITVHEMLNNIRDNESVIAANGTVMLNSDKKKSPVAQVLEIGLADRSVYKKKELEAVAANDMETKMDCNNIQSAIKIENNSQYGVQTQRGGYFYNIDTAGSITTQAREYITEMMWGSEKLLMNNFTFYNVNELITYIVQTINLSLNEELYTFIDYYPTEEDIENRIIELAKNIKDYSIQLQGLENLGDMVKGMTTMEKLLLYYKNNFIIFIDKNPKVMQLFENIMSKPDPFIDTKEIPEVYKEDGLMIGLLFDTFVINPVLTAHKVTKYDVFNRKSVLVSDTDSTVNWMGFYVEYMQNNLKNKPQNEQDIIKLMSIVGVIFGIFGDKLCTLLAVNCNVEPKYQSKMAFKNEYYLSKILLQDIRKHYISIKRVREGVMVPENDELEVKGRSLKDSNLNKEIKNCITEIIYRDILKTDNIDLNVVLGKVVALENTIRDKIKSGTKSYGLSGKYKGLKNYNEPLQLELARSAMVWNALYPGTPIAAGDGFYLFKTRVRKVTDTHLIKDKLMREKVEDIIFNVHDKFKENSYDYKFAAFGLSCISIPKSGEPHNIPEWLIDIIDIDMMIDRQTSNIVKILASIGIFKTKPSSTVSKRSTLLSL